MPRPALYLNGVDLATLGYVVERVEGLDDAPEGALPTAPVAGMAGTLALSQRPVIEPRQITVNGHIVATSQTAVDTTLGQLKALASGGPVRLVSVRNTARMAVAEFRGAIESPLTRQYRQDKARVALRFTASDPYLYDVAGQVIGLTVVGTAYPLTLGTAPVRPLLRIFGAVTNPGFVYRDATGTARCTLGYTVTLGANDRLEHNFDTGVVITVGAGTPTLNYGTWTTKADGPLVLDPHDGDPLSDVGPTVELTGSGATGELLYRRAYR